MLLNDILRPPLFELGDFRFRMVRAVNEEDNADEPLQEIPEHCMAKIETNDDYEDEEDCLQHTSTLNYTITNTPTLVTAHLDVPPIFFKHIIGHKGTTRKRIEMEIDVKVKLPPVGKEGPVAISGSFQKRVESAITRISLIIEGERKKMPFTHFLSFPIANNDVIKSFERFRGDILLNCQSQGVDSSIFQNPQKLHLTLGVMGLYGEAEVGKVERVLNDTTQELVKDGLLVGGGLEVLVGGGLEVLVGGGLEVLVEGLEVMNDDTTAVDVLYAKVKCQNHSLQTISDTYVLALEKSGFLFRQSSAVKLHVTLMNTLYRKGGDVYGDGGNNNNGGGGGYNNNGGGGYNNNGNGGGYNRGKERECFDATEILERFQQHHFGTLTLTHLHLSKKSSVGSDGYYKHEALIQLS